VGIDQPSQLLDFQLRENLRGSTILKPAEMGGKRKEQKSLNFDGQRRKGSMKLLWNQRWWLRSSPAYPNDHPQLELPGAWEPPGNLVSSPFGEEEATHVGLPYGNQVDF
jgi:hypothetical protein